MKNDLKDRKYDIIEEIKRIYPQFIKEHPKLSVLLVIISLFWIHIDLIITRSRHILRGPKNYYIIHYPNQLKEKLLLGDFGLYIVLLIVLAVFLANYKNLNIETKKLSSADLSLYGVKIFLLVNYGLIVIMELILNNFVLTFTFWASNGKSTFYGISTDGITGILTEASLVELISYFGSSYISICVSLVIIRKVSNYKIKSLSKYLVLENEECST